MVAPPAPPANGTPPPTRRGGRSPWPLAVRVLGWTSFFADVASEMIVPLLPVFLTGTLGASVAFLGLVEGVADTVASGVKYVAGGLADRVGRKKPLVVLGYAIAGAVKPLLAASTAAWHVLGIRFVDRVGKGVRTSPRDALLADGVEPSDLGRAFGFHRAMDHAGALVGAMAASGLVALGIAARHVFLLAAIPAAVAVLVVLRVPEAARAAPAPADAAPPGPPPPPLSRRLRAYLGILGLFSLGNSSDAFLLLRASDAGVPVAAVPLLWAALHVVKSGANRVLGGVADRVPRTRLIRGGWLLYAVVYLGLGFAASPWAVAPLFLLYGVYYGLCEPSEKVLVRDLASAGARGRAYGAYGFVTGAAALPASLLTGALWQAFGPRVALGTGAGLALLSSVALARWERSPVGGAGQ